MTVKRVVYEFCRRCGKRQAEVGEDGRLRVWHRCRNPVPGPPDYPRTLDVDSVIFVTEEDQ